MTSPANGTQPAKSARSPWDDQGPCAGQCGTRITRYGPKANGTLCPDCREKLNRSRPGR